MGDDDLALSQTHQRLNRVDRVFDMLGEQQLTIQNQDVAIQALEERLQTMEDSNRYDFGTLQEAKHVDAQRVDQLTEMVEKLQKQLHVHMRDYQRHVGREEERMVRMEERVEVVAEDVVVVREEVASVYDDAQESVLELVEKVAQQFDAIEESLRARDAMHEKHVNEVMSALEDMRQSHEQVMEELKKDVLGTSQMVLEEARRCVEERCKSLESAMTQVSENEASTSECVRNTVLPSLENMRESLMGQQSNLVALGNGMEDRIEACVQRECAEIGAKTDHLSAKFVEYKSYVARLRHELHEVQEEFQVSRERLIERVTAELDSAEENMTALWEHLKQP